MQELCGKGSVHNSVVGGEAHVHHRPDGDLAVHNDRLVLHCAHAEDRHLRLIYDGREALYAVHAEVGYSKRAAVETLHRELARCGQALQVP